MFNSSTVNPDKVCVVVILTLITKPKWSHIHCDQTLPDNYFLCESKFSRSNATTYYRHEHQCHKLYTYHAGECWSIQYNNRTPVIGSSTLYSTYFITFSAWAYGQTIRNQIQIFMSSTTTPYCILTHGLPNHFRKTWISVPCNQNDVLIDYYTLGQVHPASYIYTCSGIMHFNCIDHTCILSSYVCDGFYDCPDESDEFNNMCVKLNMQDDGCGDFHFLCLTGRCIHATQLCDHWQHCDDGSDELYCTHNHDSWISSDSKTETVEPYVIQVKQITRARQLHRQMVFIVLRLT